MMGFRRDPIGEMPIIEVLGILPTLGRAWRAGWIGCSVR
jgi:hypothetical protein